ncbi:hypothetical protein LCL87_14590 [Rhodococcus hoagii]|nr:hypothetical protein [Prescottella equi]
MKPRKILYVDLDNTLVDFQSCIGSAAYKRLILSHHKHLNRGDFLVDDRHQNGAGEFDGDWIPFRYKGERNVQRPYCDSWDEVTAYLLAPAQLGGRH